MGKEKNQMKTLNILFAIIIFFSIVLCAQDDDVKKLPGYFDFGNLESLDQGEEGTEVFIEEYLLKMVAKLSSKEDKELADLLNGLKLVKVNTLEVTKKNEKEIKNRINSMQSSLKNNNWERIVRIREKGEDMSVYLKTDKNSKINGLVVAGVEGDGNAIFVNIVGDIDLETIGKLSDKFDIPSLSEIHKNKKD